MVPIDVKKIAKAINGKFIFGSKEFVVNHVVLKSSRVIEANTLYFYMDKKSADFHSFMKINNVVIVTDKKYVPIHPDWNATVLYVKNVENAFWKFVQFYRGKFEIPVIGVTGTCGKTTTKEMIKHILKKDYNVHGTLYSQNGLHLNLSYLLGINERTEAAVFEMGVASPGNIRKSAKYFKPNIGVITNIGEAHLEGCKTLENYINAKGEMIEILPRSGTLIINGDDENIKKLPLSTFKGRLLTFGVNGRPDFLAGNITYENGGMLYSLCHLEKKYEVFIPGYGEHNVYNSLAAIISAYTVGVSIDDAILRLKTFSEMDRHVKTFKGYNGSMIIDDTWSCNPSSVISALEVLKNISNGKKEVLVLGKMQRLGTTLKEQHEKMGKTIMGMGGVDLLITVGKSASITADQAIASGMDPNKVIRVSNATELERKLDSISSHEMYILFKMSLGKMDSSYRKVLDKYRLKSNQSISKT